MATSIHFDNDSQYFLLRLKTRFYALRVLQTGELVHVGSGPLAGDLSDTVSLPHDVYKDLDNYEESQFVWESQGLKWDLPTFGDITYHDSAFKVAFQSPGSADVPTRGLRLRYEGHDVRHDVAPALSAPTRSRRVNPNRETLCIHLRDISFDLRVTVFYRLTPDHDIIERWIAVENETRNDVVVESLAFGTVHLPNGH